MKRFVLGVAASLLGLSVGAASPPEVGAPVIVKNTPLEVSLTIIPQEMDQRRPIDVQIVGDAAVDVHRIRSQFLNMNCEATVAEGTKDCDTGYVYVPEGPPAFIRMVSFLPFPYRSYPATDFPGLSCQAMVYISLNDGEFMRVIDSNWSPVNLAPTHVALPKPIVIPPAPPPGTKVQARLRLIVLNGDNADGCHGRVKVWATIP